MGYCLVYYGIHRVYLCGNCSVFCSHVYSIGDDDVMKIFSRDYLVNELGLPYDSDCVIDNVMIQHKRWSVVHRLIFKDNGKTYRTYYEEPATEEQEIYPWEDEDEIECEEVIPVETKVTMWVAPEELNCVE